MIGSPLGAASSFPPLAPGWALGVVQFLGLAAEHPGELFDVLVREHLGAFVLEEAVQVGDIAAGCGPGSKSRLFDQMFNQ